MQCKCDGRDRATRLEQSLAVLCNALGVVIVASYVVYFGIMLAKLF